MIESEYSDEYWMQQALVLAQQAEALGEVPVGAVVVLNNEIIGQGFNQVIHGADPTAHAEIVALRDAAANVKNYRIVGATLFVTLEPCSMCAGAMVHSRISRVIYGATEPKAGAIKSQSSLLDAPYMNFRVTYTGGVCEQACSQILRNFFAKRRLEKKG